MLNIFGDLKEMCKVDHNKVKIDGNVFRMLSSFTVIILVAFSILLTATEYVGKPIECLQDFSEETETINTFCWIHSTFTMPKAFWKSEDEDLLPYPGIDNSAKKEYNGKRKYYQYYRWVSLALFCQAILCHIPRWLWKMLEGGQIRSLIIGLKAENNVLDENRPKQLSLLVDYLHGHLGTSKMWTKCYLFCELLALVNFIGQLYAMDLFFEGEFRNYGLDAIKITCKEQIERNDIMIFIFPRVTKCEFRRFGPSASIEKLEALCILPLNVINEKIYLFIWFWFLAVAVILVLLLIIRVLMIFSYRLRCLSLRINARTLPQDQMSILIRAISFGDWYFFKTLGRNLDSNNFSDILKCLVDRITEPSAVISHDPAAMSSDGRDK